ncbi:uncharacterized protein F5147DRAFT_576122 [Suillus discolor]|uniref:DUF6589 domain-containing protein n=1 Tax=Suillus discolor TaxID=1912936 RepID=A0A9P7F9H6_9AGAM|nr:uncharacterized protein F5147DRAFT_576122 [Suillus discolor]KAG2109297.1 hypothetical protein F5147DRAFT_576122 [Suillus discolor]
MSEHVLLVHGDLLTKERLDTIIKSRRIEDTPKCCFQHVVFVPGLFHFKMACADALWHTWIQPQAGRTDVNSLWQHVGILRPHESGKFASKPGFRWMHHDVLHHDLWASILDCWLVEAQTRNSTWDSLEVFAKCAPSWELIVEMSESIINKFVANTTTLMNLRQRPRQERDQRFENQVLRNRNELLYVDLCHAMNSGDIGQVEASFLSWIYIFKATKKHKYAYHTARFMVQMRYIYPEDLQQLIRLNWLCNLTGKAFKFRPVDWLVERNNLYTKVIFAGKGSNRTIQHIINESPLIELYRECHVMIENGFHLKQRTIKHAPPNMTKTLQKLCDEIRRHSPHIFMARRHADCQVEDEIGVGMIMLVQDKEALMDCDGEVDVVGVEDVIDY